MRRTVTAIATGNLRRDNPMEHSVPAYDGEARLDQTSGERVLCSRPTCRMELAEYDPEQGVLWRTPGWTRQDNGALRLTAHNRKRLKRGLTPANRRAYHGSRMSVRSDTAEDIIVKPEVFICDLCPVRVRTLVDPTMFDARVLWEPGDERWERF
jgi:hypothetical protein